MATKVFILANKNSAGFLEILVKKSWDIFSGKDGRKSGRRIDNAAFGMAKRYFQVKLINDIDSFNKTDFKNEIKIKDGKHETVDKIFIFITPELFWQSDHMDEGYEYALDILNHQLVKDKNILQIRFLSVLPFENLLANTRSHLKRMVEAFPFFDLIGEQERIFTELYNEYSPTHFHLIKKLAVSDTGYINYLLHEINGLINSSKPSEEKDRYVLNCISGLGYLDGSNKLAEFTRNYTFSSRVEILKNSHAMLNDMLIRFDSGKQLLQPNKYTYKVLVVEDDASYRVKLKDILTPYFSTIDLIEADKGKPFNQVLKEKLPKESVNYEIIFLDLLYKNENGSWAEESGLDLYKSIKEKNNFCVTPLITSLPRAVVASLIKEIDEIGIPYHLLLSKANGEDYLKLDFKDKLPDIIRTCQENQKRKKMFKPIPMKGIFEGLSVPGILMNLMVEKKDLFNEIVNTSQSLYEKFKVGELTIDTTDWNKGELPSQKMKNNISETYLLEKLPSILTHRLMVIDFALKNEYKAINAHEYEDKILNKTICNITILDKGYLTTKLGFNVSTTKDGFIIEFKNFFPHELAFVSKNINDENNSSSLTEFRELNKWFLDVLMDMNTYDNWDELELEYNPYNNISSIYKNGYIKITDISENLTVSNLINFLNALVVNFFNEYVSKIMEVAAEKYNINENKTILPPKVKFLFDRFFDSCSI